MRRALLLLGLALALAPGRSLNAQLCATANGTTNGSCTGNVATSLTIPTIVRLTISDPTTLTPPTEAIYTAGSVVTTGPLATIKTNTTWSLTVRATTTTWNAVGANARANKPVGDLLWGLNSGGPFTAMTTTATTVTSGTRGAANNVQLYYRTLWNISLDGPGTYSLTVSYTVTAP